MNLWKIPQNHCTHYKDSKQNIIIMTSQQAIGVHNSIIDLNLRYYRPCCIRGNNPKTYLQITQEGDEKQF